MILLTSTIVIKECWEFLSTISTIKSSIKSYKVEHKSLAVSLTQPLALKLSVSHHAITYFEDKGPKNVIEPKGRIRNSLRGSQRKSLSIMQEFHLVHSSSKHAQPLYWYTTIKSQYIALTKTSPTKPSD